MLNPKIDAKELVNRFYYIDNPIADNSVRAMDFIDAKECALICIDEISKKFNFPKYNGDPETEPNGDEIYLLDMIKEIKDL